MTTMRLTRTASEEIGLRARVQLGFEALLWLRAEYIEHTVVCLALVLLFDLVDHTEHGLLVQVILRVAILRVRFLLDLFVPARRHRQCPQTKQIDYTHPSLLTNPARPAIQTPSLVCFPMPKKPEALSFRVLTAMHALGRGEAGPVNVQWRVRAAGRWLVFQRPMCVPFFVRGSLFSAREETGVLAGSR